jgi:hypothetical protein
MTAILLSSRCTLTPFPGGYDALNPDSGWPYVFTPEWNYVTSNAWSTGDPNGPLLNPWSQNAGGTAMQLRLMPPTSANAPAEDWSRTYLVVEYSGPEEDYNSYLSLPFKEVLGSLNFSRTANGTKSVTFSGEAAGQVKISNNDRVEIIPREEMGQTIRIALHPLEVCVPDVPLQTFPTNTQYSSVPFTEMGATNSTTSSPAFDDIPDIISRNFKHANEIKVALFKYSLSNDPVPVINFLKEPDSFIVRIAGHQIASISGSTINIQAFDSSGQPDGDPHVLTLTAYTGDTSNAAGLYSPPMILVTDEEDRASAKALDANNHVISASDRVFKVKGGGSIKITSIKIKDKDPIALNTANVPAARIVKQIPATFYILDNADDKNGADALLQAQKDVDVANERLLQFGIKIIASFKVIQAPDWLKTRPAIMDMTTAQFVHPIYLSREPSLYTQDQIKLADLTKKQKGTDVIVLYGSILDFSGKTANTFESRYDDLRGLTVQKEKAPKAVEDSMTNRIYISFKQQGVFTLAHEFGHYLTQRNHFGRRNSLDYLDPEMTDDNNVWALRNLMRTPTSSSNSMSTTKRLSRYQESIIYSEGALKP